MKYFIVESTLVGESLANAVTVKDTYAEARMVYHQVRASQLANSDVQYGSCIIYDGTMRPMEREYHGKFPGDPR